MKTTCRIDDTPPPSSPIRILDAGGNLPLAIQQSGTWYTYGIDLPKNITEVYSTDGYIKTAYTYIPYGLVTASGSVTQAFQWSSEYADTELGLVYYNYRYYNPTDGRWTRRDPIGIDGGISLYLYTHNSSLLYVDILGQNSDNGDICCKDGKEVEKVTDDANRKCCEEDLKEVKINVEPCGCYLLGNVGHAWVKTPNMSKGLYPQNAFIYRIKALVTDVPGEIRDDKKHDKDADDRNSYTYKACPESVDKVEDFINEYIKQNDLIRYSALNGSAFNCCGWACYIIESAGFTAPYDPKTPGLVPAAPGTRGYESERHP